MELLGYWNIARGNAGKAERYRTQDGNIIIKYISYSTVIGIELYGPMNELYISELLERHVLDSHASKTTGSHLNAISRDKNIREDSATFMSNYRRIWNANNGGN